MRRSLSLIPAILLALVATAQTGGKTTKRFVISDFGAVADGQTVNTKAIQSAIDKCAAAGGGVVVVPKGTFLSGAIFLKQGVNLSVEKDGVLKGTTNIDDYPVIHTRWEGTEEPWTSAFVNAEGLTGLEISGEGTIDGSGEEWLQNNPFRPWRRRDSGAPPPPPPRPRRGRPRLIGIQNSKRVRVAGLNLHNQAVWCLFFLYSEDVVAENLKITAEHNIPSSDGIDIDSSQARARQQRVHRRQRRLHLHQVRQGRRRPARQPSRRRHRHRELALRLRAWRRGDGQRNLRRHPQRRGP